MADDAKPKSSELVLRALVRLPAELALRASKDEDDFVRRKQYKKTGLPENGISLFRKEKFATTQGVWDRLGMVKPSVGLAECAFGKIKSKGLKYKVTGENAEHISLRCPDFDMSDLPAICKPAKGKHFGECPFFDVDTFDLEADFELAEKPAKRNLTAKPKRQIDRGRKA
jgi:hypothetical protein